MCEHRNRFAVSLALCVTIGGLAQQFRKRAVPAGHRMQARADAFAFPHAFAFSQRFAVAAPVDRAKRYYAKPE